MRHVSVEKLERLMRAALEKRRLSVEHIDFTVGGLILASLRGIDSHGVRLFHTYIRELDGGRSVARPEMKMETRGAVARMDAGGALGLVAGMTATRAAIELARSYGVGAVSVCNSNHYGAASYYTIEMARQGMVGLSTTGAASRVAPFNGRTPFLGTNPISLAAQAEGNELFCLDMATSQICYSSIKHARATGQPLQPGWAVDANGQDSSQAGGVAALQPLGGYKGQGLGMMVDVLSSLLSGAPLDHELSHLDVEPFDQPRQVGHFFLVLDVSAFQQLDVFRRRLSEMLAVTRAQPPGGETPVIVPGDREQRFTQERRERGIPLDDSELRSLLPYAQQAGVEL